MVVGEQQILGQVKEAYGLASAVEAAGPYMSRLCNRAFATPSASAPRPTSAAARHRRWRSSSSRRSSAI